jgi:hypothetical protein
MKSAAHSADSILRAIALHGRVMVYFDPSGKLTSVPETDPRAATLFAAAKSARRHVGTFGPGATAALICSEARAR